MKIYHNPRCQKSREALEFIHSIGIRPEIIEYLVQPPTVDELKEILDMLQLKPMDIVRVNEPVYKEKYKGRKIPPSRLLKILVKNPKLIQRPIIILNGKAVIGRPATKISELL